MLRRAILINVILFGIALFSAFSRNIINGPYVADPGERTMTIRWESDSQGDYSVKYGIKDTDKVREAKLVSQRQGGFLYEVCLGDLKPGTRYVYSVVPDEKGEEHTFKTIPRGKKLNFAVLGDSRSKAHIFSAIAGLINEFDPSVIIANGDLVAKGGNPEHWHTQFFEPSKDMTDHIPFLSAVGDHESDDVDGDSAKLFTYYLFPHKDKMKLWFSYDIGDAHFIFLDWRYPDSEEMISWFKKDISSTEKTWKFVVMHRPPYNLGGHHVSWGKVVWPDLFQQYKVDVVFSGHSHLYERFWPLKPVMGNDTAWAVSYITTGGAGASLYEASPSPSLAYTKSINHFLKVTLDKGDISIKAIGVKGETLDSVSWSKKKGQIDGGYLAESFPKEEMDIINVFNTPISERIDWIPMVHVPLAPEIVLDGRKIKEDVNFSIHLADESEGKYMMEPVTGILKAGTVLKVQPEIYGRTTMTVSKWGTLKPVLRLIADYNTKSFSGSVKGVRLEYISY
jgi:hypothetical protein